MLDLIDILFFRIITGNFFWMLFNFIRNAESGSLLTRLSEKIEKERNPDDIIKRALKEPKTTFLWVLEMFYQNKDNNLCDFSVPWKTNHPNHLSFGFPKGSPMRPFFFHRSIKLFEAGTMDILKQRYLENRVEYGTEKDLSLGIEKLIGLFAIFGIGIGLAIVSLLVEFTALIGQKAEPASSDDSRRHHHQTVDASTAS